MILVLDTETTGISSETHEVIELAVVELKSRWSWSALIKPASPIPPEASAIHHLTAKDFEHAYETFEDAWAAMRRVAGGTVSAFAAHSAAFDKGFVEDMATRLGKRMATPWLCTWRCALHLYPDAPGYGNQVLRYYLDLQPQLPINLAPHRALYDTLITAELLARMLELKPLEELLILQDQPVLLRTCRFGKHAGTLWKDIPKDYLEWILRDGKFDKDAVFTARHWLRS